MICSCLAEISATFKFCPRCGQEVAESIATTRLCSCQTEVPSSFKFCPRCGQRVLQSTLAENHVTSVEIETTRLSHTGETTTLTIDPWSPPLPGKYTATLAAGMKPEIIIWKLFKHKAKLRNLLESVVMEWPADASNRTVESAEEYLRSHCVVCGERTMHAEPGRTPLCIECETCD